MRVRISYGVELDEVPSELRDLTIRSIIKLKQTVDVLEKNLETMVESDGDSNSLNLVNAKIDSARQEIANADAILNDVQSILGGLIDVRDGRVSVDPARNSVTPEVVRE